MIQAQVFERFIEYAANLQRVDAVTRLKVFKLLQEVEDELIKALNDIDPTEPTRDAYKIQRLNMLLKQVKKMLEQKYKQISGSVISDLKDLAKVEVSFNSKTINNAIGVEIMAAALPPQLLTSLVSNTLILGGPAKEWWERQSNSLQRRFADEIRRGMAQGETLTQLSQRVRGTPTGVRQGYKTSSGEQRYRSEYAGGIMDASRREADALVRTAVQAVSQNARAETYRYNDDVVKGYQALVVLDSRTSQQCMALSGLAWDLEGNPIGGHGIAWPGYPPYHFNCRTTLIPLMRSWEELAPAHKKKLARKADSNAAAIDSWQSSMDGPVSAKLNYEDWLKTKPLTFQQELLGPTKYKLWKAEKITFRDLIDQSGNPLTVEQLMERFG